MYCVSCGVKLANTEKKCPLCNTDVFHPTVKQPPTQPLYPKNKMPQTGSRSNVLNGAIILLFFIPLLTTFFCDFQTNGRLDWFGVVAGALVVSYVAFALPHWFKTPNPVIFVPCSFAAITLYVLYINYLTDGEWFLSFAFPVIGGLCLITCTVVTLTHYLRKGRLYIIGGAFIALGVFMMLTEFLLDTTFHLSFVGWSIYPLVVLALLGGLLIFLAINHTARETLERKLFF